MRVVRDLEPTGGEIFRVIFSGKLSTLSRFQLLETNLWSEMYPDSHPLPIIRPAEAAATKAVPTQPHTPLPDNAPRSGGFFKLKSPEPVEPVSPLANKSARSASKSAKMNEEKQSEEDVAHVIASQGAELEALKAKLREVEAAQIQQKELDTINTQISQLMQRKSQLKDAQ